MDPLSIRRIAENYCVEEQNLRRLFQICPVTDSEDGEALYDQDDLARLLSDMGEDVGATATLAMRLKEEFGYIPADTDCVSEGGGQVMYYSIVFGDH